MGFYSQNNGLLTSMMNMRSYNIQMVTLSGHSPALAYKYLHRLLLFVLSNHGLSTRWPCVDPNLWILFSWQPVLSLTKCYSWNRDVCLEQNFQAWGCQKIKRTARQDVLNRLTTFLTLLRSSQQWSPISGANNSHYLSKKELQAPFQFHSSSPHSHSHAYTLTYIHIYSYIHTYKHTHIHAKSYDLPMRESMQYLSF